jgi:hypothetical protein
MSLDHLSALVASGDAVLFTGAGFSADARDCLGRRLPRSVDMASELWSLLFGDEPADDSTLPDLFDVAIARCPDRLRAYLHERLTVGDDTLPGYLQHWFAAPWRRIYTLNIDDLECAVSRRFPLPCPLRTLTMGDDVEADGGDALDVIHLNGFVGTRPDLATFSTSQYAARLCRPDPLYARLCDDLMARPFVFAGTVLDEPVFWQHLELARSGRDMAARPRSLLVTRSLSRARHLLLETLNITWIAATVAEAAEVLDAALSAPCGFPRRRCS